MTQSDDSASTQRSSRHRARQSRARQLVAHLWSEWRVEILVLLLVALAVFLLVEQMQIRQTLLVWLRQAFQALGDLGGGIRQWLVGFVQNTTLSDLTGYALLLIALAFVVWRTRWRLMTIPRFTESKCPYCGSDLHRIHRRWRDRVLGLYVPLRRYRCGNRDCRWEGLRVSSARPK